MIGDDLLRLLPATWGAEAWHPLTHLLAVAVGIVVAVVLAQILWLLAGLLLQSRARRRRERFRKELEGDLLEALDDPGRKRNWIARSERYPSVLVRDSLEAHILATRGAYRHELVKLYREAGLHRSDLRDLRSSRWQRRAMALRRLLFVADADDLDAILERKDDLQPIRLMAAFILGRVSEPTELLEILNHLRLPHRLMEQSIHSILAEADPRIVRGILSRWDQVRDPRLRRVLLVFAADRMPDACVPWLPVAAAHPDLEIRIGACVVAGRLPLPECSDLLASLLQDPHWQVRARAARAAAGRQDDALVAPLRRGLRDPFFWVRQNAAASLRALGEEGFHALSAVARRDPDRFAMDAARQELQRRDLTLRPRNAPS